MGFAFSDFGDNWVSFITVFTFGLVYWAKELGWSGKKNLFSPRLDFFPSSVFFLLFLFFFWCPCPSAGTGHPSRDEHTLSLYLFGLSTSHLFALLASYITFIPPVITTVSPFNSYTRNPCLSGILVFIAMNSLLSRFTYLTSLNLITCTSF